LSEANKNIENLFKKKLENHESIVRPDLWDSISSSIPAAGTAASAIALKTKILVGVAASIITAATVYYFNQNNQSTQTTSPQKAEQLSSPEKIQINTNDSTITRATEANATELKRTNATSKKDIAEKSSISTVNTSQQTNTDTLKIQSDQLVRSTVIDVPDNRADNSTNLEKAESVSSKTAEPEKAAPPVMQIKEVENKSLLYFLFSPQKASAYEWWIDDKLVSNNATFNYNFENDGNYAVRLVTTSAEGTKSEATQNIEVYRNISFNLPNAFSPNGDGMNDVFNVENGIEHFQKIDRLLIQDKNGKSIYESSTKFIWDGSSMDGNICPSGVYTYTIFAIDNKNNPQMKAGTIQLFVE
jgi:gliding motility-associated-like protein